MKEDLRTRMELIERGTQTTPLLNRPFNKFRDPKSGILHNVRDP